MLNMGLWLNSYTTSSIGQGERPHAKKCFPPSPGFELMYLGVKFQIH